MENKIIPSEGTTINPGSITESNIEADTVPSYKLPNITSSEISREDLRRQRLTIIGIIIVVVILIAILGGSIYALTLPSTDTARVRDIFIILMALESMIIGLVLVILVIQIAQLINLLQNEIKPILDSTNETVNTLRGTTTFLSNNLVDPVIKLNEYLAGLRKIMGIVGIGRDRKKSQKGE